MCCKMMLYFTALNYNFESKSQHLESRVLRIIGLYFTALNYNFESKSQQADNEVDCNVSCISLR
jgi:hypothetical protein